MVGIGLDYDSEDWEDTAIRVLRAGASLTGVPADKVALLQDLASEEGLELKPVKTTVGWELRPFDEGEE